MTKYPINKLTQLSGLSYISHEKDVLYYWKKYNILKFVEQSEKSLDDEFIFLDGRA